MRSFEIEGKQSKKRILYIVSTLKQSGPTNQLYDVVKSLSKDTYFPKILTLSPEIRDKSMEKDFLDAGIIVQTLGLGHLHGMLSAKKKVQNVINEFKPNIIHSSGIRADAIMRKIRTDIPWCATIHNYCKEDYTLGYGFIKGRILAGIHTKAIKQMPYPICCSQSLKSMYEQSLSKKMYAIQNGVDIRKFNYDERKRAYFRKKYNISENTFIALSLGNLNKRKDPMTIINSVKQIKDDDLKLYVIGDGPMREICESNKSENIIVTGRVDQIEEYLSIADAYISASMSEGLPSAVLEVGAAGIPMILSDIPQHREIWGEESDYVLFFQIGDTVMLKNKIERMKAMQSNSQNRERISESIKTRFSIERMCHLYQNFYDFMIENKNSKAVSAC